MNLNTIRFIFMALCVGAGLMVALMYADPSDPLGAATQGGLVGLFAGLLAVSVEIILSRRMASLIPSVLLGLFLAALSTALTESFLGLFPWYRELVKYEMAPLLIWLLYSYIFVLFVIQTRGAFRLSIPYVEFKRQGRGNRPFVVDSSALIDGRIMDLMKSPLSDRALVLPRFVLEEVQSLADNSDKLVRAKGRRGLEVAQALKTLPDLKVDVTALSQGQKVDAALLELCHRRDGILLTTDFNLTQVASLQGVECVNLHEISKALKRVHIPGEVLEVELVKPGQEEAQGVGYLDDGTMVVVDRGRDKIGKKISVKVTGHLQTSAGRLVFARAESDVPT
ncbi:MAG: PIN/TRAM domain-containing protein [Planctomycetota bacterium]